MKTYDGAKLVLDRLAKTIASYPEGSVTARTIVATIPVGKDPEKTFNAINAAITANLNNTAEKILADNSKLRKVKLSDEEIESLTSDIVMSAKSVQLD